MAATHECGLVLSPPQQLLLLMLLLLLFHKRGRSQDLT